MKILALIINILGIPVLILGGMMAITSPMLFDAPGSEKSKSLWAVMYLALLLPVLILLAEFLGWKNYLAGDYWAAILSFKWALLDVLIIIVLFATK